MKYFLITLVAFSLISCGTKQEEKEAPSLSYRASDGSQGEVTEIAKVDEGEKGLEEVNEENPVPEVASEEETSESEETEEEASEPEEKEEVPEPEEKEAYEDELLSMDEANEVALADNNEEEVVALPVIGDDTENDDDDRLVIESLNENKEQEERRIREEEGNFFEEGWSKVKDVYSKGKGLYDEFTEEEQIGSELAKQAKKGDADAQYKLGLAYYHGKAVGYSVSVSYSLSYPFFASGAYVTRDYEVAYEWFLKAAYQGHAFAQAQLSKLFYKGYGVKQDLGKAFIWYRVAQRKTSTLKNWDGSSLSSDYDLDDLEDQAIELYNSIEKGDATSKVEAE